MAREGEKWEAGCDPIITRVLLPLALHPTRSVKGFSAEELCNPEECFADVCGIICYWAVAIARPCKP